CARAPAGSLRPGPPARVVSLAPRLPPPLNHPARVPAQPRHPRRLEPCRPTADHHDEARLFGIHERSELALPTALRRLDAADVQSAEQSPEAAFVGADAMADFGGAPGARLRR